MVRGRFSAGRDATGTRTRTEMVRVDMWNQAEAEAFFYQHGGYYVKDGETVEQARRRCAQEAAEAEQALHDGPYFVATEPDPEPWDGDMPWDGPILGVLLMKAGEGMAAEQVDSLWGVAVTGEDDPYIRVVAADLMIEELRRQAQR